MLTTVSIMEIFELRYFTAVANHQNIHRASERLNVSPGSLSKAISRLEAELNVKLFKREGRNIVLTDHGKLLQRRASEIVHLEETAKQEVAGKEGTIHVVIAGPEVLLGTYGLALTQKIKKRFAESTFEFHSVDDDEALKQVQEGEAHLALTTADVPSVLHSEVQAETTFRIFVGKGHPLFEQARAGKKVSIDEILRHSFACPSLPFLGTMKSKQSLGGWRDDKFPRKTTYLVSSLKVIEELVSNGSALAYLPDYIETKTGILPINVIGCPYACVQKIKLVVRDVHEVGWLKQVLK